MDNIWSKSEYLPITELVRDVSGLTFPSNRLGAAQRCIDLAMKSEGIAKPFDYLRHIRQDRAALDRLVDELTVGETYFFREQERLEYFRRHILPELLARKSPQKELRLWSAGCSTGEEPYTLAIILQEDVKAGHFSVLATDICRKALAKAAGGVYSAWSFRGVDHSIIDRYFSRQGDDFALCQDILSLVTLAHLNLTSPSSSFGTPDTANMDIIFCRNVLIYFDRPTIKNIAERLFNCLSPGGWLVTGASDPTLALFSPFETVSSGNGTFLRRPLERPEPRSHRSAPRHSISLSKDIDQIISTRSASKPPEPGPTPKTFGRYDRERPESSRESSQERAAGEFAQGNWKRVIELLGTVGSDRTANIMYIRSLMNLSLTHEAEAASCQALEADPLSSELNLLKALLLMQMKRHDAAAKTFETVIYLDRSLAVAHFSHGIVMTILKEETEALKSYRNAHRLCQALPADEEVPFAEGERAGVMAQSAVCCIKLLEARSGAAS